MDRTPENSIRCNRAQPAYSGIKHVFQAVYREGGVRALYRGVGNFSHFAFHFSLQLS